MKRSKKRIPRRWRVVATAHTMPGLREAAALSPGGGVDLVEIRLDCLGPGNDRWREMAKTIKVPIIITARHPREGGSGNLSAARRGQMLAAMLPAAALVDVELRSAKNLGALLSSAKKERVDTVISFHDFKGTPSLAALREKVRAGLKLGASVVKVATTLHTPRDLVVLIELQKFSDRIAAMGMGPLGKVSRLVLPLAGASLVYGYLDRPQVSGQWPAKLLAARLSEIAP